jgi:zinc D-Ala-D-Ala carboxypeptidase
MRISTHLDLVEVTRSETAKRNNISNQPTAEHLANFKKLAENIFEPIRKHFGVPIHISSGYRSVALNKFIKGSATSQHCTGEAIDIDMDGSSSDVTNKMVFDFIKDNLNFDQLIFEFGTKDKPDWVHVSFECNGIQRNKILRAIKKGSKTEYQNYA